MLWIKNPKQIFLYQKRWNLCSQKQYMCTLYSGTHAVCVIHHITRRYRHVLYYSSE
jgi:hypothetical protein